MEAKLQKLYIVHIIMQISKKTWQLYNFTKQKAVKFNESQLIQYNLRYSATSRTFTPGFLKYKYNEILK